MSGIASGNALVEADGYDEYVATSRLHPAPLVSVLMITYNHAEYLAEAIEGVLSQRCDFPIELIIGEDASTDGTREIAMSYHQRHPELIRLVCSQENAGARANIRRILARARGRYVAWCEGDDYWCDASKLQHQVQLIESGDDIGVVHSDWVKTHHHAGRWVVDWSRPVHRRVPEDRLQGNLFRRFHNPKILRTCTRLARKDAVIECFESALGDGRYRFDDAVLAAYLTSRWKVAYLPRVTAVYRLSPNSTLRSGRAARIKFMRSSLEFDNDARELFKDRIDYPESYRWELGIGLALWGLSVGDMRAVRDAVVDLQRHFGPGAFVSAAWETLRMRLPGRRLAAGPPPDPVP